MRGRTYRLASLTAVVCAAALAGCPFLGGPALIISPRTAFSFNKTQTIDSFSIRNGGGGVLEWSIASGDIPAWLTVSPLSGAVETSTQTVTMVLNAAANALAPGNYQDRFTVASNGGDQNVFVSLTVTAAGDLIVEPREIEIPVSQDGASFTIRNGGTEALNWELGTITPSDAWLRIAAGSPTRGTITTGSQTVQITADRTGLDPGTYEGSIVVTSDGGTETVNITLIVGSMIGELRVDPESLAFQTDGIAQRNIGIRNVGSGQILWTIDTASFPEWLRVNVSSDTATDEIDRVVVTVDATRLAPGEFAATIRVTARDAANNSAGEDSVAVTLTVPEPQPKLRVTPLQFNFGPLDKEDFFTIRNVGTGTLNWSLSVNAPAPGGGTWIVIDPSDPTSGSLTTNNQVVDFSIDRTRLNAGLNTGTITITSNGVNDPPNLPGGVQNNGVETITIRAEVLPPTLTVVPDVLDFSTNITQKVVAIFNSGAGTVNWSISPDTLDTFPSWLRDNAGNPLINKTSGSVSGEQTDGLIIRVNRDNELPGRFQFPPPGSGILIESDATQNPTASVRVLMQVSPQPVLAVETGFPQNLDGTETLQFGVRQTQLKFRVFNAGTSGSVTWRIDSSGFPSWLTLDKLGPLAVVADDPNTPEDESLDVEVTATVNRAGLPFGAFRHIFAIEAVDTDQAPVFISAEMVVEKRVIINAGPPIALGPNASTTFFLVANFGDPDTVLNFGIASDKPWLFAFPEQGQSIGVVNPELNADVRVVNVAVDRANLDEPSGGSGTLTIFAQELITDEEDLDGDGDRTETIFVRNDDIAPPVVLPVSVEGAALFFEAAPARLRVPSQVRYIMMMRNLRFEPIQLDNPLPLPPLSAFEQNFRILENDIQLEATETNQFLTDSRKLKNNFVILLDYSGSALQSAITAQMNHAAVNGLVVGQRPELDFSTILGSDPFAGFEDAEDPLQFIYQVVISELIRQLPSSYNLAIMEFHDRNQRGRLVTNGFIRNEGAGRQELLDALAAIRVRDNGATELIPAIIDASTALLAQDLPLPSTSPVQPVTPFDDADVRGIIMISDGRLTTGPGTVDDAIELLLADRTRLFSIVWGNNFNPGPMAAISAETGGHLYVARPLPTGARNPNTNTAVLAPAIHPLFDFAHVNLTQNACDVSIARDLNSQAVLSYVTLSVEDSVAGRVNATFNDPTDNIRTPAEACKLGDQGNISGGFEQELRVGEVIGTDLLGLGVNLGQMGMRSTGIQGGPVTVTIFTDFMPREIRKIDFVIAAQQFLPDGTPVPQSSFDIGNALTGGTGVAGVMSDENGIFRTGWTITQTGTGVDATTGLNTRTFRLDTGGEPIRFGSFGDLVKVGLFAPGLTPYTFRLLSVTSIVDVPAKGTVEEPDPQHFFVHPDGIPINNQPFLAPVFPTPRIDMTILDFGTTSTTAQFIIRNVGGSFVPGGIFLDWQITGGAAPAEDIVVQPPFGQLASTADSFTVTVRLDRDRPIVGPIRNLGFELFYNTGIFEVTGSVPFQIAGTILPPVLSVTSTSFAPPPAAPMTLDFGAAAQNSGPQTLFVTAANTGQSTMRIFRSDDPDAAPWITMPDSVAAITNGFPATLPITVDRARIPLPSPFTSNTSFTHDIEITATTSAGAVVGRATIHTIVTVVPQSPIVLGIPNQEIFEGSGPFLGPEPQVTSGVLPITWSLQQGPAGMTINASTGQVFWPTPTLSGSPHTVIIRATNVSGFADVIFSITVKPKEAPIIAPIPNASVLENQVYNGPAPTLLAGSPPITWSLVTGPAGMTIDPATGRVQWFPAVVAGSPHTVTIRAENTLSDGSTGFDEATWRVFVEPLPVAPVLDISGVPTTVVAGDTYNAMPALVQGTQPLTWILLQGPTGMTIDAGTGAITWPNAQAAGDTHTVRIRVLNSAGSDTDQWTVSVTP